MVFSVIIPTCRRLTELAACLERLAPGVQTLPAEQYEVIVTDDTPLGAEDASDLMRAKFCWARWVCGPRRGPAANRNHGVSLAHGDWLAFTDDDCLPEPDWLQAYACAVAQAPELQALEGAIHPLGEVDRDLAECPVNLSGGCFWSANIAVRADVFRSLGGFDEQFVLAAQEDQDLKIRIEQFAKIPFVASSVVRHPVRIVPVGDLLRRIPGRNASLIAFQGKHGALGAGQSLPRIMGDAYGRHARILYRRLRKQHWQSAFVSLVMLGVGLPHQGWLVWLRSREGGRAVPGQEREAP